MNEGGFIWSKLYTCRSPELTMKSMLIEKKLTLCFKTKLVQIGHETTVTSLHSSPLCYLQENSNRNTLASRRPNCFPLEPNTPTLLYSKRPILFFTQNRIYQQLKFCKIGKSLVLVEKIEELINYDFVYNFLAEHGKASGCSTKRVVIHKMIHK